MTISEVIIKQDISELCGLANDLGRYYVKGMGARLQDILSSADNFIDYGDDTEEDAAVVYGTLERIERFYGNINFDILPKRQEFFPLHAVRHLLLGFREELDSIFRHNAQSSDSLDNYISTIMFFGNMYRDHIESVIERIRSFPQGGNFKLKARNLDGAEVDYPIFNRT